MRRPDKIAAIAIVGAMLATGGAAISIGVKPEPPVFRLQHVALPAPAPLDVRERIIYRPYPIYPTSTVAGTTTTTAATTTTAGGTTTTAGGTTTTAATTTTTTPTGELATPASYFGNDVINHKVTTWAVDSNSAAAVAELTNNGATNNSDTWMNEDRVVLMVPGTQAEVLMAEGTPSNGQNWCGQFFSDNDAISAAPPAGNYDSLFYAPVPSGVYYSSASTDDEVAILSTGSSPQEYDFWLFGQGGTPTGSGNQTFPGQIIDPYYSSGSPNPDVNVYDVGDAGQLATVNNPPAMSDSGACGASASGLSEAGTTITEQDVYNALNYPAQTGGGIDHALSLEIPYNLCNGHVFPAVSNDCSQAGTPLAEGQYFRLSSSANCSTSTSGPGTFPYMVCYALQNYGMIVMDRNTAAQGDIFLEAEDPYDWTFDGHSGTDPFTTAGFTNQGAAMNGIPWTDLQLVDPPACVQSNPPTC